MIQSISSFFTGTARRSARAQAKLAEAYTHVFTGSGEPQEAEIVLADLAREAGYYHACSPEVSTEELRHREGKRALFARIVMFLNLPSEAHDALQAAVMREDGASNETGLEL